jgi:KUP system potassium uptake protein
MSRVTFTPTDTPGMRRWRKRLFITLARNAASPVGYFDLPADRTVTVGETIPV